MKKPCPYCDQPDASLLRLVLIGEILRADEVLLWRLAEVMQQCGLLQLSDEAGKPETTRCGPARVHCIIYSGQAQTPSVGMGHASKAARGSGAISDARLNERTTDGGPVYTRPCSPALDGHRVPPGHGEEHTRPRGKLPQAQYIDRRPKSNTGLPSRYAEL